MPETQRWAVITGASSGIGAELARVFAARGYALALVARRRERLEALAGEIGGSRPIEILVHDLEDPAAPDALMAELAGKGIQIHTLVNNAGFGLRGAFASLPLDRQMGMIALNVTALTKLSRLALPGLTERRWGGILNVASIAAFQAGPNMAIYYASKAFVLSLSEALHEEAKPHNVVVTALCPGPTATEFAAVADMEHIRAFKVGAMSAADVARAGVDAYEAGKAVIVPGVANQIGSVGAQFLPRWVTRKIAGRIQA